MVIKIKSSKKLNVKLNFLNKISKILKRELNYLNLQFDKKKLEKETSKLSNNVSKEPQINLKYYIVLNLKNEKLEVWDIETIDELDPFLQILNPNQLFDILQESIQKKNTILPLQNEKFNYQLFLENLKNKITKNASELLSELTLDENFLFSDFFRERTSPEIFKDNDFLDSFDGGALNKLIDLYIDLFKNDDSLYFLISDNNNQNLLYDFLESQNKDIYFDDYYELDFNYPFEEIIKNLYKIKLKVLFHKAEDLNFKSFLSLLDTDILSEENISELISELKISKDEIFNRLLFIVGKKFELEYSIKKNDFIKIERVLLEKYNKIYNILNVDEASEILNIDIEPLKYILNSGTVKAGSLVEILNFIFDTNNDIFKFLIQKDDKFYFDFSLGINSYYLRDYKGLLSQNKLLIQKTKNILESNKFIDQVTIHLKDEIGGVSMLKITKNSVSLDSKYKVISLNY